MSEVERCVQSPHGIRNPPRYLHSLRYTVVAVLRPSTSAALQPLGRGVCMGEDICISTHRLNRALCYRGGNTRTPSHNTRTDDERTEYTVRSTRTETPKQGAGGRANEKCEAREVHAVCCYGEERDGEYAKYMQSPQSTSRSTLAPVHCRSCATTEHLSSAATSQQIV